MSRVTVVPEEFTLVPYEAATIASLVEEVAGVVGFLPAVPVRVEVDEELFAPLTGHSADVADGEARLWISGANLENKKQPRTFAPEQARVDFAVMLLRAGDRLDGGFADAPPDAELSRAERAAWDVFALGRAARLGFAIREPAARYDYRLQHGFTDAADAVFERLREAEGCTWSDLQAACVESGAAERPESKVPVDILQRG